MNKGRWLWFVTFLLAFLFLGLGQVWGENLHSLGKKGREAFEKGDFPRALDAYTKAQLESPEKPEISYNLGNVQYRNGDFDAALLHYKSALKSADRKLKRNVRFNMGNAFFRKGDYDKAIGEYEEALKLDETDNDARRNLEFTKKVRDRKKNEPPDKDTPDQDKKQQDDKNDGRDKKRKEGDDSGKGDGKQDDPPSKDHAGDDPDDRGKQNPPDQEKSGGQRPDGSDRRGQDRHEGKQPSGGGMGQETDPAGEGSQADTMLKRLEDQPGKALLLDRRPRKVEKDW